MKPKEKLPKIMVTNPESSIQGGVVSAKARSQRAWKEREGKAEAAGPPTAVPLSSEAVSSQTKEVKNPQIVLLVPLGGHSPRKDFTLLSIHTGAGLVKDARTATGKRKSQ